MSVTYDWSPVFNALNLGLARAAQQGQYDNLLTALSAPGAPKPSSVSLMQNAGPQPEPMVRSGPLQAPALAPREVNVDTTPNMLPGQSPVAGPLANNPGLMSLMRGLDPQVGMSAALPLLLKSAFKEEEFDPTPRYDQYGNAFYGSKSGGFKYLPGIKARDKIEVSNGMAYNPYHTPEGFRFPDTMSPEAEAQKVRIAGASRPQMSVNVSADRSFGTQLGENAGKILDASHSAAAGGIQTLNTVQQIRGALDTGKVTAGPGASAIQFFNQVSGGDPEKVVATRQAIQGLAQLTMAGRSALKGQGQISDYEGKLLAKASSGDIDSMTVGEIAKIADVAERNARISIRLNKENVAKARRAAPGNQDLVDFYDVAEPASVKRSGRFTIEQQ